MDKEEKALIAQEEKERREIELAIEKQRKQEESVTLLKKALNESLELAPAVANNDYGIIGKAPILHEFLVRISSGESMSSVCKDPHMPSSHTIQAWAINYPEFREAFNKAKILRTHSRAEELMDLADNLDLTKYDPKLSNALVAQAKLKSDNIWRVMAQHNAKDYGSKTQVDISVSEKRQIIFANLDAFKEEPKPIEAEAEVVKDNED